MPIRRQHVPLGLFLTVSLLLHALLLWQHRSMDLHLAAQTEQLAGKVFHLSLRQDDKALPAPKQKSTPPATLTSRAALTPAKTETTPTTKKLQPVANPDVTNVDNTTDNTTRANSAEARARVLHHVREDFEQHFYYPLLARRHGWQGQVLLGFSVAADGMIGNVHVQRGSGHAILDESAQTALLRIKQLHRIQHWLAGQSMQLQLSVVYRLQGG